MKDLVLCTLQELYPLGHQCGINTEWLEKYGVTYFGVGMTLCYDAFPIYPKSQDTFFEMLEDCIFMFEIHVNKEGKASKTQNIECSLRRKIINKDNLIPSAICMHIRLINSEGERFADFNLLCKVNPMYYSIIYRLLQKTSRPTSTIIHQEFDSQCTFS